MRKLNKTQWCVLLFIILLVAAVISIVVNSNKAKEVELPEPSISVEVEPTLAPTPEPEPEPEPEILPKQETTSSEYTVLPSVSEPQTGSETDWAIEAIARTLAGECYDDMLDDKRKVAEVILNRVSKGYGDTVTDVVTAPNQFMGYYNQSREISNTDREIAAQAVQDWYDNDCQALSDYLYFGAGGGKENVFRTTY